MGSVEVVLDEPIGQLVIEILQVCAGIALTDEFVLECAIEPLTDSVVLRSLDPAPPVHQLQVLDRRLEVLVELRSVVRLDMRDLPTK